MLLKLFKQSKPIILIFVLILAIISRGFLFIQLPESPNYAGEYPLFSGFWNFFSTHTIFSILLSFILLFVQASWMNRIAVNNGLVKQNSVLPVLLYILFSSSFHTLYLSPIVLGQLFILLAFDKLLRVYPAKNVQTNLFNAAILLSVSSIICPELSVISLSLILFILIYGLSELRNWMVTLLGLALPFSFFISYELTILETPFATISNYFTLEFQLSQLMSQLDLGDYLSALIVSMYFIAAFSDLNKAFSQKNIQKRFSLSFILWTSPLIVVFFMLNLNPEAYLLTCIPITLLLSNYFMHKRENIKIHLAFNLLILLLIFGPPFWTLFK